MKGGVTVDEVRRVAAVKRKPAPGGKPQGPKGGVKKG